MTFFSGFSDELTKLASVKMTAKQLVEIAKKNPSKLKSIAKEMAAGPGGSTAKGVLYGSAGYSALRGLGYRDKKTKRREPLEGALRGAGKGALVGVPAFALLRYPALRRAVARHATTRRP